MENASSHWTLSLTSAELAPIVGQILGQPTVDVLDWQIHALAGGVTTASGRGLGVYRLSGSAGYNGQETAWTVVLKVLGPTQQAILNDPATPEYWKREVLAYQSGVLDELPGNLAAPRCYGVQELPDGECHVWLEAIHEADGSWTLEQHHLAARHLGQFNGAYLAGHPMPEPASWMLPGRLHKWIELYPPDFAQIYQFSETE